MEGNYMSFGERLVYARKQKGLKQIQFAELIGVKSGRLGSWENNRRNPNASMIRKITTALGVSEDWFENDDNFSMVNLADNQEDSKLTKEQQQLVIDNQHIIYCVLKKYNLKQFRDEFWDIGEIGLCEAAQYYDKNGGTSFYTVAFVRIKWLIFNEYKYRVKDLNPTTSFDQTVGEDDVRTLGELIPAPDEWEQLEYKILVESLCQKVEHVLSAKEKEVFRPWLHGEKNSYIAKKIGVTPKIIKSRLMDTKKKIRALLNPDDFFS